MSNSPLVTYTRISPNKTSPRNHKIDTISIHCTAGNKNNTAKQIADLQRFTTYSVNNASCNYAIGGDGSKALVVDEKDRSWCTSSGSNDHRAITIEVASNTSGTEVTDAAYKALIDLLVDICHRNGIKKLVWSTNKNDRVNHLNGCNMTVHRDYANKACPGEWLYSRHGQIAAEVNQRLYMSFSDSRGETTPPKPQKPTTGQETGKFTPFRVRVTASVLNIRAGAGTNYGITGQIKDKGVYTIVQQSGTWGKLKSGAGWISLNYTKKV